MSAWLSEEMRQKYNVWSIRLCKDDELQVAQEHYIGQQIGNAVQVHRKKYIIYIKWVREG
eukprot:bmy_00916T0